MEDPTQTSEVVIFRVVAVVVTSLGLIISVAQAATARVRAQSKKFDR